jgi:O-antigen/teichoic acid export membrane protein
MGAGRTIQIAVAYAQILATGTVLIFFAFMGNAILRAEGDAKRAMVAMVLGGVVNVILDPIFIYTPGLGVLGAAWATVISMSIPAALLFYCLFLKKDTYVTITLRGFHLNKGIIKDILQVGLPASVMQLSMAIMMIIINLILNEVGGIDGMAVFFSWMEGCNNRNHATARYVHSSCISNRSSIWCKGLQETKNSKHLLNKSRVNHRINYSDINISPSTLYSNSVHTRGGVRADIR